MAVVVGMAVGLTAGLVVASRVNSSLLLTAVVTVAGTGVSRLVYERMAKAGSRPIDDETCPL